jgi:DNA (cytosine-5)-methyltransferase 1
MTDARTFLELFAGGGMARIGYGPDWTCVLANDIDPKKCSAYARNFGSNVLVECDVAQLPLSRLPACAVDSVWMSPPCQDTSEAGTRKGLSGARSSAFWSAWRKIETLIAEGRSPRTLVYENPIGAKTKREGDEKPAAEQVRDAFTVAGYGCATFTIKALSFLPQSRERVLVAGALGVSDTRVKMQVNRALAYLKAMPKPELTLNDIVDPRSEFREYSAEIVEQQLAMASAASLDLIAAAREAGRPVVMSYARRTRNFNGVKTQTVEVRKCDIANALKVASAGGSSHQFVMIIDGPRTRVRAIGPNEGKKLMGLPADYVLPRDPIAALDLLGDGVAVPVVRFIIGQIVEPLLEGTQRRQAEAKLEAAE